MRIASFDIGKKNLALYIEDFDPQTVSAIPSIPRNRFDENRIPTTEFRGSLDALYSMGESVYLDLFDVSCGSRGAYVPKSTFLAITTILQDLSKIFDNADLILIEEQVRKNLMAMKIAQHIYSWFLILYGPFKEIVFFSATSRNHTLGCPKKYLRGKRMCKMTYRRRKKWAVEEAERLIHLRDDESMKGIFSQHKDKRDDFADAILDVKAWQLKNLIF